MFPPTDLRPLLDKTASYMAKKGRHIEAVVLSKGTFPLYLIPQLQKKLL